MIKTKDGLTDLLSTEDDNDNSPTQDIEDNQVVGNEGEIIDLNLDSEKAEND